MLITVQKVCGGRDGGPLACVSLHVFLTFHDVSVSCLSRQLMGSHNLGYQLAQRGAQKTAGVKGK